MNLTYDQLKKLYQIVYNDGYDAKLIGMKGEPSDTSVAIAYIKAMTKNKN